MQSNILRKAIFQIIWRRNLQGHVISQLSKKEPKELLREKISVFFFFFLEQIMHNDILKEAIF